MDEPQVLALVLTFCSPKSLDDCLRALEVQERRPDGLLVVDNAGDPVDVARPRLPDSIPSRLVPTGQNLGPAGGHARGLREFLADERWTHAWVMDDDCVPEPSALAELLRVTARPHEVSVVFPNWVDGRTQQVENAPAWCGFVISREAVTRAGLPREELFWWIEDTEYLMHRLPRRGVDVRHAPNAVVWHWPVRRGSVRPPWRVYYETRNSTWFRLHIQRTPHSFRRWLVTVSRLAAASMRDAPRHKNLAALVRGLRDGLLARLGRTVVPPTPDGKP